MKKRRQIEVFSISFLDLLSGALGAVIILYVAIPKQKPVLEVVPKVEQEINQRLQTEIQVKDDQIKKLEKQLQEAQTKVVAAVPETEFVKEVKSKDVDYDIGFKFKGKNIVFLIDTSFSMHEEDRMGQVKAGVKMLLTSLPKDFKVDVIQFPFGERGPFRSMWGTAKENSAFNKQDAFDFIYALRPRGGTPTRDALLFVLKNYDGISDIVLLSDGAPTFHNSNKKDDIHDILRVVREENPNKVQINCIGVGADFVHDKSSERYQFLSLLSAQSEGFFVGF